jgi:hypothetical protein
MLLRRRQRQLLWRAGSTMPCVGLGSTQRLLVLLLRRQYGFSQFSPVCPHRMQPPHLCGQLLQLFKLLK